LFRKKIAAAESDLLADAELITDIALTTFDNAVRDLEAAGDLLLQVEAEALAVADEAIARANAAADLASDNARVAGKIAALVA
jgi:hypothetical protein